MRVCITGSALALLLALSVSCSKKNSDAIAPSKCLYIGKTVLSEVPSFGTKTSSGNEISWNDQKQMVAASRFEKTEGWSNFSNNVFWTNGNQTNFTFVYDSNGFLTQKVMKLTSTRLGEGSQATPYKGRKYENFVDETKETSDYQYESGRAVLVNIQVVKRLLGNNEILLDTTSNYNKTYSYDGNGNAISATETNVIGKMVSTFKNGLLTSATLTNTAGQWQWKEEYDDKGDRTAKIGNDYRFNYTRDAKGNLTTIEYTVDNKVAYTQDFTFDDQLNPESTIPKKFKGIPDLIPTVQTSAGVNNLTGEKYNGSPVSNSYESKSTYLYNADGLPESSSGTRSGGKPEQTETTTFRYKCP